MSMAGPCLRADLSITQQVYRGEASFVVKDLAAQKYFRFGSTEVRVMRCFDGRRTPSEIAASLANEGLRISTQAVEGFARKLASAGFLERSVAERSTLQLERLRAERDKRQRPTLFRGELLRMRWSFGDPDAMLTRTMPSIRWMFTRWFAVASIVLFCLYLGLLANRWTEFVAALSSTYSFQNIGIANVVTLWTVGAVVILIHELGHGYACKYFGGEVRELGFMLIYFQPAFYCNVSDAWSFRDRSARLWVTAAGGWIQFVVASAAAVVWWAAAPGTLIAEIALAAMLVGGVTTLFTNANPLLPLDGYFALSDWLEIPNLRHRAFAHFQWWVKRNVFRLDVPEPTASFRQRRVFLVYGALSFVYVAALFVFLGTLALGWADRALGTLGVILGVGALLVMLRKRIVEWGHVAILALRARRLSVRSFWRRTLIGFAAIPRRARDCAVDTHESGPIRHSSVVDPGGHGAGQRHHRASLRRRGHARQCWSTAGSARRSRAGARDPRRGPHDRFTDGIGVGGAIGRSRGRREPADRRTNVGCCGTRGTRATHRELHGARRVRWQRRDRAPGGSRRSPYSGGGFAARARGAGLGRVACGAAWRGRDSRSLRTDCSHDLVRRPVRTVECDGDGRFVSRRNSG
jgi:hypothetical protein